MISIAIRRAHGGLGALACLSAGALPLWLWVGSAHLGHWSGGEGAAAWEQVMGPWAGRLWSGLAVICLVGWGGYFPVRMPRGDAEWSTALTVGVIGLLTWAIAGIPGWVWLAQIGHLSSSLIAGFAFLGLVPPILALVVTISGSVLGERQIGVAGGMLAGALTLWLCAGWF